MFRIVKSIDIDFAHHVTGHPGACINIHGHTWKFEVCLESGVLDDRGFVCDFGEIKADILTPVHTLLDHSLALFNETYMKMQEPLRQVGEIMYGTRKIHHRDELGYKYIGPALGGANNLIVGGIKLAVFSFPPTSERLAEWLYKVAAAAVYEKFSTRIGVTYVRVYETLHPVEAFAEFRHS